VHQQLLHGELIALECLGHFDGCTALDEGEVRYLKRAIRLIFIHVDAEFVDSGKRFADFAPRFPPVGDDEALAREVLLDANVLAQTLLLETLCL
jgi:hypothetical protein